MSSRDTRREVRVTDSVTLLRPTVREPGVVLLVVRRGELEILMAVKR